jgi:hypothetical protein
MTEPTYAEVAAATYQQQAQHIPVLLRRLADQIAQLEVTPSARDLHPDHTDHAQQIVHEVTWGVANLGLPRLVHYAGRADRAAREGASHG